jgi:hypothetical protein
VRNYLPDILCGYALVFSLAFIFGNNAVQIEKIFIIAFSFSVAMKLLQLMPSVHGTFDVLDIVVEFLAEGLLHLL